MIQLERDIRSEFVKSTIWHLVIGALEKLAYGGDRRVIDTFKYGQETLNPGRTEKGPVLIAMQRRHRHQGAISVSTLKLPFARNIHSTGLGGLTGGQLPELQEL